MFLVGVALVGSSSGQVFVPDTNLVYRLQQIVPDAMNGHLLDETHADVLAVTALYLQNAMIDDLTGIEHFTGATHLNINGNGATILPAWPPALVSIDCANNYPPTLPPFPSTLRRLNLSWMTITSLPPLPDSLTWLRCMATWLTELPELPSTLDTLDCSRNQLTALPALPDGLLRLACDLNNLGELPELPASLRWLSCSEDSLTALPALPDALEWLQAGRNQLTQLPTPLPSQLKDLRCHDNDLTSLPPLPEGLTSIICHMNALTTLPTLPSTLTELNCGTNQISALPELSDSLTTLDCHLNQLTTLPEFPSGLEEVNAQDNPLQAVPELPEGFKRLYISDTNVECMPLLPSSFLLLYAYNTPLTCVPNRPAGSSISGLAICDVATSPCPIYHPFITGHAFYDTNNNGVRDAGDLPCPIAVVEAPPSTNISGCDAAGYYAFPVDTGNYVVNGHPVLYHSISTPAHNVSLAGPALVDSLNDIGYAPIPGIYDLVAHVWANPARPGFANSVSLNVRNIGTEATTVDVQLDIDAVQVVDSTNVMASNIVGNICTWMLPVLAPGEEWLATAYVTTPVPVPIGTGLTHILTATPAVPDTTPDNNTSTYNGWVVGSFDPNAKQVQPQSMSSDELAQGDRLHYTIQFQNTGNYPAERVVITDTLSQDLLPGTFAYIASSHACSWYIMDRVLHVLHEPIHLPDSVNNEPESHGFFAFSIQPSADLMPGDQIHNTANIYFDYNAPVITDPAIFSIEVVTDAQHETVGNVMLVSPVPAHDLLAVTLPGAAIGTSAVAISIDGRMMPLAMNSTNSFDISHMPVGAYLLRLTDGAGTVHLARFIKE